MRAPNHPLAPPGGLVSAARLVLFDKIGPGPTSCHWCGTGIRWQVGRGGNLAGAITADHVDSNPLDDSPENIVAACGPCNGKRGFAVGDDELYVIRKSGVRARAERKACESCGSEFLVMLSRKAGTGRFCSRRCARKHQWATRGSGDRG